MAEALDGNVSVDYLDVKALRAERDRYRAALRRIATQGCGRIEDGRLVSRDGRHAWLHWEQIAHDALCGPATGEDAP